MNLEDYADILNLELVIRRYPNQSNRYCARFERVEVMRDGLLVGVSGNAASAAEALASYAAQIAGTRIAVNAYHDGRREYDVPKNLKG